jgi:transcriptional regulator with XRE-family HTH domain
MDEIGARIRQMREALGLTQSELAQRAGVTAAAVSQWENRQTKGLKGSSLIRAAEALGVEVKDLMEDAPPRFGLPADEESLLQLYRSLPAGHQVLAHRLLKALK